jgi:MFS family permease
MTGTIQLVPRKNAIKSLYGASFVLSFHLFFVIYMNSSFLSSFIDEKYVGSVYVVSSIFSVLSLLYVSDILRKFGNYKTLVFLIWLELFSFLGMAFIKNVYFIIPIFIGYSVIFPLIFYSFDVFIEGVTERKNEGEVRGVFMTVVNTALVIAPLVAGYVISDGNYGRMYFVAALFLIPLLFLVRKFKNFTDPKYHSIKIFSTLKCIRGQRNLNNIFMAQFLMRFFFSWMVIYMPIFLHNHIGFSWPEIGTMTAIMLLPFAVIEYPAGKLADNVLGEKELLIAGFVITSLMTGLFAFIEVKDFIFWTTILLLSRVGASLIEIMTEVYFFKHVDDTDTNTISFFRITRPVAYIIGPLVGTIALLFIQFQMIWIVLGLVTLSGVYYAALLEDTK